MVVLELLLVTLLLVTRVASLLEYAIVDIGCGVLACEGDAEVEAAMAAALVLLLVPLEAISSMDVCPSEACSSCEICMRSVSFAREDECTHTINTALSRRCGAHQSAEEFENTARYT